MTYIEVHCQHSNTRYCRRCDLKHLMLHHGDRTLQFTNAADLVAFVRADYDANRTTYLANARAYAGA